MRFKKFFSIFFAITTVLVVHLLIASPTSAQTSPPPLPPALQQDAINKLASDLSPEQVEALGNLMSLLQQGATAKVDSSPYGTAPGFVENLQNGAEKFGDMIGSHILSIPLMISDIGRGLQALFTGQIAGPLHIIIGAVALLVAGGMAAEYVFNRLVSAKRERIATTVPGSLFETVKIVSARAALDVGGLIIFAIVAFAVARVSVLDPDTRRFVLQAVYWLVFLPRLVAALLRFALAPQRKELRLVTADDGTAKSLYLRFTAFFAAIGVAFILWNILHKIGATSGGTFRFFASLLFDAWIMAVIWKARHGLTSIILGDDQPTSGLERMARFWPYFSIGFIGVNWFVTQLSVSLSVEIVSPGRGLSVIALVVFAPFLDTMVRGIVSHIVPPMQGDGPIAEAAHLATRHSYVRIARVALISLLILLIGRLYGVNLLALGGGAGTDVARNSVIFLLILAAGYLAWEITNLWVSRQLAKDSPPQETQDEESEMGGAGKSRLATILPLIRIVLQVAIITLTVLLGLSQLGINITPLLAGAGVVGLAVGFGAQTLVRDVVAGIFFLMDDAFRMGEFIDTGGVQGTIEKISVRSLQLRGTKGAVHIVPYGEIPQLTNLSRDWVIMKLKFTIPFDTDQEKVRKIFKKIGQEIMEMDEYKDDMLAPFKGQGVADVDDVGIVVRGKFTTKPGKQFGVRREIYKRVQTAFEENGIQFARKEVRVQIPENVKLDEAGKEAVAAAAAEAAAPKPAPQS